MLLLRIAQKIWATLAQLHSKFWSLILGTSPSSTTKACEQWRAKDEKHRAVCFP